MAAALAASICAVGLQAATRVVLKTALRYDAAYKASFVGLVVYSATGAVLVFLFGWAAAESVLAVSAGCLVQALVFTRLKALKRGGLGFGRALMLSIANAVQGGLLGIAWRLLLSM